MAPSDVKKDLGTINGESPLINFDPFAPLAPPPPSELQIAGMTLNNVYWLCLIIHGSFLELDLNVPPPQQLYVSRPRPKPSQVTDSNTLQV